ncbi:MAG: enoyl-CoA hydratase/isomerase family protein [Acidobacteriota bacterium]|nr:MAG: enoyl-CoA hydratase/isomerase family protein [Acidobacteriota bacterium]
MSEYQEILYQSTDGIAWITLNRPEKRNALNDRLVGELKRALGDVESDESVRVAVFRGAGKDFCAGADLSQLQKLAGATVLDNLADASGFAAMLQMIRRLGKPVIAAVHGRALAGGAGLASACDLVIAARSASFCYTEVRIGFVPAIVTAIARRNLSEKRAFEILCTGRALTAEEAERIGFINRVCDDESFDEAVREYAAEIAKLSGSAVGLTKSLLYQTDAMTFDQAIRAGVEMNAIARMTPDCQAGIKKFLSKS